MGNAVAVQRTTNSLVLAPGVQALPFTASETGIAWSTASFLAGLVTLLTACAVGYLLGHTWGHRAIGVLYLAVGFVLAVVLLDGLLRHKVWTFDRNTVCFRSEGPLRRTRWQEAVADYAGVLTEAYEGAIRAKFRMIFVPRYKVLLSHTQTRGRDVCFYDGPDAAAAREIENRFASMFSKPVLSPSRRTPDELLREVAGRRVPELLSAYRDETEICLSYRPTRFAVLHRILMTNLGWPAVFLTIGLQALTYLLRSFALFLWITASVVGALALSVSAFYAARRFGPEELRIDPRRVVVRRRWPWGLGQARGVRAADIRDIFVHSKGSRGRVLQIVTEDGSLWWGMGLPLETLCWVRDCIAAVISRETGEAKDDMAE